MFVPSGQTVSSFVETSLIRLSKFFQIPKEVCDKVFSHYDEVRFIGLS